MGSTIALVYHATLRHTKVAGEQRLGDNLSSVWGAFIHQGCVRMIYLLVGIMSVVTLLVIGQAFDEGE